MRTLLAFLLFVTGIFLPVSAWAHHVPPGVCEGMDKVVADIKAERDIQPTFVTMHDAIAQHIIASYNEAPPPSHHIGDVVLVASHPSMVIMDANGAPHPYVIIAFFANGCLGLHDRILTEMLQRWLLEMPKV